MIVYSMALINIYSVCGGDLTQRQKEKVENENKNKRNRMKQFDLGADDINSSFDSKIRSYFRFRQFLPYEFFIMFCVTI